MEIPSRNLHININTRTIFTFFLVGVSLLIFYHILDVLLVILASIILASAIEPVVRRFKRFNIHRIVSVICIYLCVIGSLIGIFVFFVPVVVNDAVSFLKTVPASVSLGDMWSPFTDNKISFGASAKVDEYNLSLLEYIKNAQSLVLDTTTGAFKTAGIFFGGFLSLILIIVISFYLAVQEDGVDDFLRIITPVKHHEYIIDLWKRSQRKIGLWLQGQVLLGIIVGVLVYLVLLIVGIPHALVLALLAALLEIIPVFGPIIASVPAILIAFTSMGAGTGLLIIFLYIIIHQFESQIFYPLVVKKVVGISPIIVIIALVIGAKLAGVLGALIAVPLSAALMEYIKDIEKYKKIEIADRETVRDSKLVNQ